jgi:hypothetical protein
MGVIPLKRVTIRRASTVRSSSMKAGIVTDRYVRLKDFLDNLYNVDGLAPRCVSDQAWQASFNVAAGSGAHAI